VKPGDGDMYPNAIIAAEKALNRFERYGHGTFLWRAYQSARVAAESFPAYRDALLTSIKEMEDRQRDNPGAKAWFEGVALADHGGMQITDESLMGLTERILRHIDALAGDLLQVKGTSSAAGAANLRKALRMNDQLNPISAAARVHDETIINEFFGQEGSLSHSQNLFLDGRFKNPPPDRVAWNFTRVRNNVAAYCGVSGKHAGEVINRFLANNPEHKETLDRLFATARSLKPKKRAKTATRKKKRRPTKPAAWRE
jgi:hypothetical protein